MKEFVKKLFDHILNVFLNTFEKNAENTAFQYVAKNRDEKI